MELLTFERLTTYRAGTEHHLCRYTDKRRIRRIRTNASPEKLLVGEKKASLKVCLLKSNVILEMQCNVM